MSEDLRKSSRDCEECGVQNHAEIADELDRQAARITELEAIVAKLPRTADGVPVVPGMDLYEVRDGDVSPMNVMPLCGFDIAGHGQVRLFFHYRKDMCRDLIGVYSSFESAVKAREASKVTLDEWEVDK